MGLFARVSLTLRVYFSQHLLISTDSLPSESGQQHSSRLKPPLITTSSYPQALQELQLKLGVVATAHETIPPELRAGLVLPLLDSSTLVSLLNEQLPLQQGHYKCLLVALSKLLHDGSCTEPTGVGIIQPEDVGDPPELILREEGHVEVDESQLLVGEELGLVGQVGVILQLGIDLLDSRWRLELCLDEGIGQGENLLRGEFQLFVFNHFLGAGPAFLQRGSYLDDGGVVDGLGVGSRERGGGLLGRKVLADILLQLVSRGIEDLGVLVQVLVQILVSRGIEDLGVLVQVLVQILRSNVNG